MASGQNNTDINVPSEDIVRNFNAGIERCSYCWKQAEVTASQGETNKSGDLYREGLEIAQELCRCFEAKIGNTQLREKPGRRDRQDSGIDSKNSSVISQPTDDTDDTGSRLSDSHVLATSMSRASIQPDEMKDSTEQ